MKPVAAILILTLSLSCLAPAQVNESVSSVAGTSWAGIVNSPDSAGRFQDYAYEFEFLEGKKLRWRWRGIVYENGTWQQNGRDILLEMNDNYSTWRGTIEGNRMSGSSFNKEGYKWNWVLLRQTRALPPSAQIIPAPGGWISYSSAAGRFGVLLPAEPRVTEQGLNIGARKLVNNVFLALTQFAVFVVSYADFPPNTSKSKSLLDNMRRGVIDGIKGTLISSSNISHKGYPGREFRASSESGLYTSRIFLVNARLYQLVVVAVPGKVSSEDVQRFLNSFDLKMEP
jgi:hypothetical protein